MSALEKKSCPPSLKEPRSPESSRAPRRDPRPPRLNAVVNSGPGLHTHEAGYLQRATGCLLPLDKSRRPRGKRPSIWRVSHREQCPLVAERAQRSLTAKATSLEDSPSSSSSASRSSAGERVRWRPPPPPPARCLAPCWWESGDWVTMRERCSAVV
ncbi:hypothetical protein EYF80_028056 [Liparis tanakae]|uniref:Uncharacterized protein n=1 Tax=Liparis tanakae TaxID=230148 RepID=A0A4Z2H9Y6_9TELE|nr:hypothetical protein EYF80_028056 [Liparis tanakae]